MSIRRCWILVWAVATLQVLGMAQDQPQIPQSSTTQNSSDDGSVRTAPAPALSAIAGMQEESGTEDTSGDLPPIPSLLGGPGISTAFQSELQRSNYLRGGINVSATYDDNPLLSSNGGESNTSETIFPSISIDESTPRMHWTLGYAGGLTVNQNITSQNEGSHNLNFSSQFRLSPHVNLRVAENFSMTAGFFDAVNGAEVVSGSGGPNPSLIAPLSTERSSITTVETNYHFALRDMIGASGSFSDLHFSNVPAGAQLTDTETAAGSVFWQHLIFHGDWSGLSYRFDRITYNSGSSETRVHSFLATNTLSLWKRLMVTGSIGPQYSENQGLVVGATESSQSSSWSISGGVEGGWHGERTSLSAGFSRSVSDGGGLLGAVHMQTVHGNFRRVLLPGWAVSLTGSHGSNQSITVPFLTSASSINTTSAGVTLERNVGKSVGLRFGYTHDFQEQVGVPGFTQAFDANRNRFVFTLSYQWARPLGM
jgi:hypothetical protein